MNITPYRPGQPLAPAAPLDVAVAPGETLREVLEEMHMSQLELASRIGASTKHVNQVVKGIVPISADVAQRLEVVTGVPARIWSRLESDYRTILAKQSRESAYVAAVEWIKKVPIRAFVKAGILPASPNDDTSRVDQVLHFFGVASVDAFKNVTPVVAFRRSNAYQQDDFAVAAWLRLGEVAARASVLPEYNARKLTELLPDLKALSLLDPKAALPRLVEMAGTAGVCVVFIPEVEGARAYGATYWVSSKRPVVQLSTRGRTLDKLWETFFHEVGHVLLHDRKAVFIEEETGTLSANEESQATAFSRSVLLPEVEREHLRALATESDVSDFAATLGVPAGIVVAELHRTGLWAHDQGRALRRALTPDDLPDSGRPGIPSVRPSRLQWKLPGAADE